MAVNANQYTIAAGESLSEVIDCSSNSSNPVVLMVEGGNPETYVTFQMSWDGSAFYDLFDAKGEEVHLMAIGGVAVPLDAIAPLKKMAFKVRIGSRSSPIPAKQEIKFWVLVET